MAQFMSKYAKEEFHMHAKKVDMSIERTSQTTRGSHALGLTL